MSSKITPASTPLEQQVVFSSSNTPDTLTQKIVEGTEHFKRLLTVDALLKQQNHGDLITYFLFVKELDECMALIQKTENICEEVRAYLDDQVLHNCSKYKELDVTIHNLLLHAKRIRTNLTKKQELYEVNFKKIESSFDLQKMQEIYQASLSLHTLYQEYDSEIKDILASLCTILQKKEPYEEFYRHYLTDLRDLTNEYKQIEAQEEKIHTLLQPLLDHYQLTLEQVWEKTGQVTEPKNQATTHLAQVTTLIHSLQKKPSQNT